MDINDLRSISTLLSFLCFMGIVVWAYGKNSRKGFDQAANLPFAEDDEPGASNKSVHPR
jgi:cytochrome c oxidase cbb3-type subunit 4